MIKLKKIIFYFVQLNIRMLKITINNLLRLIISAYMILIIIRYISRFKKASNVFINSYAFGHSIIETSAFFSSYGKKGICISVGHKKNRNKYFKDLYKPNLLIHFWLPNIRPIQLYHALRNRTHLIISDLLRDSPITRVLLYVNLEIVDRDTVLDKTVLNHLVNNFSISKQSALGLINDFKNNYIKSSNKHSSSLAYLMQIKNLINFNLTPRLRDSNHVFFEKLRTLQIEQLNGRPKVCTLIVRQSNKRWTGMGYKGYEEVISYLNEKKYIVNIIGDLKGWRKYKSRLNSMKVYDHVDYGLKAQLFQILSVMNSNFCLGDLSGAQVIPHFFGKKNLILNVIPTSQLQYNSLILPQIWKSNLGFVANVSMHFNLTFNRFKPLRLSNDEIYSPHFNDPVIILDTVKHFVKIVENNESFYFNPYSNTRYDKSITKFALNSSISPIFFRNFIFKSR